MRLHEIQSKKHKLSLCQDFIDWAIKRLKIKDMPDIKLTDDKAQVDDKRTFGTTYPTGEIWVYVGNRNTADIMRTLVHELVHHKQFEIGLATEDMNKQQHQHTEDVANALAGRIMREYGKAHVEIYEGKTGSIRDDVAKALPATYAIPELKNQDPYMQYRFGVAIAGAKGAKKRKEDGVASYSTESGWGENEIIVSYGMDMNEIIDDALKQLGLKGKKRVSTIDSEESTDAGTKSPMKPFKGYAK